MSMLLDSRPATETSSLSLVAWVMDTPETAASTGRTAEEVFRAHAPRVYNLARRMLGNDADAEDVTQDVLLQVVRKLDTFRGDAEVTTWLHRVTVNAALALRRSRARRPVFAVNAPMEAFSESMGSAGPGPERNALDG